MSIGTNAYSRSCQCRNCILDEWSHRSDHFLWSELLFDVQLVSFFAVFFILFWRTWDGVNRIFEPRLGFSLHSAHWLYRHLHTFIVISLAFINSPCPWDHGRLWNCGKIFGEKVVKRVAARYIWSQNGSHRFLLAHLFYSRACGLSFLTRFHLMFLIMVSIGLCERLAGVRSGCFFSADGLLTKGDICTPAGPVCLLLLH